MKIKAIKVGSATVQAKIGKKKYNCKIKIVAVATTEEPTNEDKLTLEDGTVTSCDKGVTRIVIPEGVTAIGDFAFAECRSLESITIPSSVATIGGGAFTDCSSLESVTIPESVTNIGVNVFSECVSLNRMQVDSNNKVYSSPNNCNAIVKTETHTLIAGCKSTTIPSSVTTIGSYAFEGCSSLESITIPEGVTTFGVDAFSGCVSLNRMQVDINNKVYSSPDNCNAIVKTETYTLIAGCKSTKIPSNITTIGDWAFYECSSLESITIPESVTTIGDNAFNGCSGLASITIPKSVTTIGNGAFSSCSQLNKVEILNGDVTFGLYVFDMCADNLIIYCAKDSTAWQYAIDKGINHEGLSR